MRYIVCNIFSQAFFVPGILHNLSFWDIVKNGRNKSRILAAAMMRMRGKSDC
jgi:hypothetical protein